MDLSKLDPNVVVSWLVAIGGLATLLYRKARGEKTKTAKEVLDDVVLQVINSGDVDLDNVRARIEALGLATLAKLKITGKPAAMLVHEFVEYGAGQLAERFGIFQRQLDRLSSAASGTLKAFDPLPPQ